MAQPEVLGRGWPITFYGHYSNERARNASYGDYLYEVQRVVSGRVLTVEGGILEYRRRDILNSYLSDERKNHPTEQLYKYDPLDVEVLPVNGDCLAPMQRLELDKASEEQSLVLDLRQGLLNLAKGR